MKKYPVFDIEKHTADYYSEIKARLFAKHGLRDDKGKVKTKWPEDLLDKTTGKKLGIQENDLWMVAIAAEHNMPFVTADKMTRLKEITRETYPGFEFLNWRTGAVPS
jgi:predicted nucleic acid-binding protein